MYVVCLSCLLGHALQNSVLSGERKSVPICHDVSLSSVRFGDILLAA